MRSLMALARKNRLLAGGIGAGIVMALGVGITLSVIAMGGSSSAAPDPEPEAATPTNTATVRPTATNTATAVPSPTPVPSRHAGLLDGTYMTDEEWAVRKDLLPLAVMFDNTPASYPHSGLDKADVVYETFVEGGITRLMAVFWKNEADFLMPVRSARTPFVIWVDELDALYGHAGSADTNDDANAGGQLISWQIKDLDAFNPISGRAYFRDTSRIAPYNLATSTDRLRAAAAERGYAGPSQLESWRFLEPDETPPAGLDAHGIEVDFGGRRTGWQLIQWKWDEAANAYLRFMFGGPQTDGTTGEQLRFNTVIVMLVPGGVYNRNGHYLLNQFGEGPATVFYRGKAIEGTWSKADRKARTRFFDAEGQEIPLERGPIFVEVIGHQSKFHFTSSADLLAAIPPYTPPPPASFPADNDEPPTPTVVFTATPDVPTATATNAATATNTTIPTATSTPRVSPTPLQISEETPFAGT